MSVLDTIRAAAWNAGQSFVTTIDSNAFIMQVNDIATRGCVFQVPLLEDNVEQLSGSIGFPVDQLKCIFGLLVTYPLSILFVRLPPGVLRHAFSLFFGLFLMQFVFGSDWIHCAVASIGTYLLAALLPARISPYAVMLFAMGYLTACHIYQQSAHWMSWRVDFTGPMMVLTIKLTSFAFNYADGASAPARANLDSAIEAAQRAAKTGNDRRAVAKLKALQTQKQLSLDSLPSPLAFLGYTFCYAGLLGGPASEMRDYLQACEGSGASGEYNRKHGHAPTAGWLPLWLLLQSFGWAFAFQWGGARFPTSTLYSPEFIEMPLWHRTAQYLICMFFTRAKYYFVWLMAEGANLLGGFGYVGGDKDAWRGARNIDIWGMETHKSVSEASRAWNQKTQTWLERYTYNRTGGSLLATYFVSAFWHGFYPGYYIFFIGFAIGTMAQRKLKAILRPMFVPAGAEKPTMVWNALSLIVGTTYVNFLACAFVMQDIGRIGAFFSAFHFIPFVVVFAILLLVPKPRRGGQKTKDKKTKAQ